MQLKYTKNISNNVNSAEMLLFDEIGGDGIDGNLFSEELTYLSKIKSIVDIKINSFGGNAIQAMNIVSVMFEANNNPNRADINTTINGVAYSAAGLIFLAGKKRTVNEFSLLQIHDPFIPSNNLSDLDKKMLSNIKESIAKHVSNNSIIDIEEVREMMSKDGGDGVIFNAEEMKTYNLVDSVNTLNISRIANRNDPKVIYNYFKQANNKTNINMSQVANLLNLAPEANEQSICNSVKDLQDQSRIKSTKITELQNSLKEKDEELSSLNEVLNTLKNEVKQARENKFNELLNSAIEEGKISEDSKAKWFSRLEKDEVSTTEILNEISPKRQSLDADDSDNLDEKETYDYLSKNDPKKLLNIMNTKPALFDKLFKERK